MSANTRAEAQAKYDRLQELIHPIVGIRGLSTYFGMDLSKYPLDGPVPEPSHQGSEIGRVKVMYDLAKRENLTIRQLYSSVIGQRAHRTVCGTPADIADAMQEWFAAGACDGFNILPLTFPKELDDLVDMVIPELQRRGLFRTEYEGKDAAREPRPAEAGQPLYAAALADHRGGVRPSRCAVGSPLPAKAIARPSLTGAVGEEERTVLAATSEIPSEFDRMRP